jgi:hypothetical protein
MNFKEKNSECKKETRNVGAQAMGQMNKRDTIENIIEIYFKVGKYLRGHNTDISIFVLNPRFLIYL